MDGEVRARDVREEGIEIGMSAGLCGEAGGVGIAVVEVEGRERNAVENALVLWGAKTGARAEGVSAVKCGIMKPQYANQRAAYRGLNSYYCGRAL